MAKNKTSDDEVKAEIDYQALLKDAEAKVTAAVGDKQKMADFLSKILVDVHVASKHLFGMGLDVGRRMREYYQEARTLLGPVGEEIDKKLRG